MYKQAAPTSTKQAKAKKVRINFGWMHRNNQFTEHKGVRFAKGGGTRCVCVDLDATYDSLQHTGVNVFFPDGRNAMGPLSNFEIDGIGSFQQLIDEQMFNLQSIIEQHGNPSRTRIYILTTQQVSMCIIQLASSSSGK